MTQDLKDLRKTAESAQGVLSEPWIVMETKTMHVAVVERSKRDGSIISGGTVAEAGHIAFRDHIATFDPPTALALIARVEQAEKQAADNDRTADELLTDRDYWEAKLTSLVYSLATEEEVGEWSSMNDIADNLIEHIGGKIQKLEQTVARVRELAGKWETGAMRWEDPLPVPREVSLIREALGIQTHNHDRGDLMPGEDPSCSCGYNGTPKECWVSRRALDGDTRG